MAVQLDVLQQEKKAVLSLLGDLTGLRVLEIGCGNGRLTWHYAHLAGFVDAIDPDPKRIAAAQQALPAPLTDRVQFHACALEDFRPPALYDLAILSWSL